METPGRTRRPRKSVIHEGNKSRVDDSDTSPETLRRTQTVQHPNQHGQANGSKNLNGSANGSAQIPKVANDPKIDRSSHLEFGGSWGVSAMMIGFPL